MPYTPEEATFIQRETIPEKEARLKKALDALPEDQRAVIHRLAVRTIKIIKERNPMAVFSMASAYELIASLGVWYPKYAIPEKEDANG